MQDNSDTPVVIYPRLTHRLAWDAAAIIKYYGGARGLIHALRATGLTPPTINTVWMWRVRNRISAAWLPTVVALAVTAGARQNDLTTPLEIDPLGPDDDAEPTDTTQQTT